MEKGASRVAKVQGIYFIYPSHLSLNQEEFLAAVLVKAKTATEPAYCVEKKGDSFSFIPENAAETPEWWSN